MEINLASSFGSHILSRNNISNLREKFNGAECILNFQGVTFISRSVADELLQWQEEIKDVVFSKINTEVEHMLAAVERGRKENRRRVASSKVSTMIYCDTMEELKIALSGHAGSPA